MFGFRICVLVRHTQWSFRHRGLQRLVLAREVIDMAYQVIRLILQAFVFGAFGAKLQTEVDSNGELLVHQRQMFSILSDSFPKLVAERRNAAENRV